MSSPTSENPFGDERPRPKWRRRRRKWYVRLWHQCRDRFLALGWKGYGGAGVLAVLGLLLLLFWPADDPVARMTAPVEGRDTIECLLPGQPEFGGFCTVETIQFGDAVNLILRSPDGDFRRLRVGKDGISAADGAEQLIVRPAGPDAIDVRTGDIVWRLPRVVRR